MLVLRPAVPADVPLVLDYIRLICAVAPASASSTEIVLAMDTTTRYSSGGTQITAFPSVGPYQPVFPITLYFGALTLAAASGNVRYTGRDKIFSAIEVVGSVTLILFNRPGGEAATLGGTVPVRNVVSVGPCVLGPSGGTGPNNLTVHDWRPSNASTAPTYEFEIGGWVR